MKASVISATVAGAALRRPGFWARLWLIFSFPFRYVLTGEIRL
ncbi:hypothetical protein [Mesoterricola sediminis]|uniref:Uncharacterized protein n=1 Tax=Mesoterricola sediminis TaxID=2927980 RepID=A0AA48KBM2_9BACT|nr:hypothetical protein [Mesoterricola sediminis]BDU76264.1 hypothetical protein METESE_12220 [Mesoterricola sediminis]